MKKVNAYDVFVAGVKDGMNLVGAIFPSLMAMILLVNLISESHLFDLIQLPFFSFPSELLAMCIFRPISGGASMAMMVNIFRLYGPDSLLGMMASVIQGSTDTTIYVLALYFSSVGIKRIRNAMWIGLFADLVGISTAIILSVLFF
jgi:spore maturation protein B